MPLNNPSKGRFIIHEMGGRTSGGGGENASLRGKRKILDVSQRGDKGETYWTSHLGGGEKFCILNSLESFGKIKGHV